MGDVIISRQLCLRQICHIFFGPKRPKKDLPAGDCFSVLAMNVHSYAGSDEAPQDLVQTRYIIEINNLGRNVIMILNRMDQILAYNPDLDRIG